MSTVDQIDRLLGFSTRFRALLNQHGHSLVPADIARSFNDNTGSAITPQTAGNWLNGTQLPNHTNKMAVATWLRVTPDFLDNGIPLLHSAPLAQHDIEQTQVIEHFSRLDAYGRRCALAMLASLARLNAGAA